MRGPVAWLTGQTLLFGAMAALLGIVANALFLEAYGSALLPVTYIIIGGAGVVLSTAIARSAGRFDLVRIAVVVLGGAAVLFVAAWVIAAGGDGAWVSWPLLVVFPLLIQLGFMFVGSQAGRLLDIAGIKASFPRIMAGFAVGAIVGGLAGGPLVALFGRVEGLLLATAIVQGSFAALVWATGRRFALELATPPPAAGEVADADVERDGRGGGGAPKEGSLRALFAQRFVLLLLAYQVLSALGSQVADFLVMDRAVARFPDAEDLGRFVAGYTAVMNVVTIVFLFLVAGPLLRRYGLRLGITANPLVVSLLAAVMVVVLGAAGGASIALLGVVSAARIADIALTDGTTRTSINALYQVLPERSRLAAQAYVEGMGVPLAIGASGVLILVLNALPVALVAMIVALVLVCVAWTAVALVLHRAYGPALATALRHRPLLGDGAALEAGLSDAALARRLLVCTDTRSARLGLEIASTLTAPMLLPELSGLTDDERVDVRLAALAGLAAAGDGGARRRLAGELPGAAVSTEREVRLRAASVLGHVSVADRAAARALLDDPDVDVRRASLESVQPGDDHALEPALRGLADPRTAHAASAALDRLGDAAVPALDAALADGATADDPMVRRLLGAVRTPTRARDAVLARHVATSDRELGRLVMDRLAGPAPADPAVAPALDAVLRQDAAHAARVLGVLDALVDGGRAPGNAAPVGPGPSPAAAAAPLRRALEDELRLVVGRVIASSLARHGRDAIGPAIRELRTGGADASLAAEALEVALGRAGAALVLPLLDSRLSAADRQARLTRALDTRGDHPIPAGERLRELVEDRDAVWRSAWLRACAVRAASASGALADVDTARLRALGDPVVTEELARADRRA